MTRTNIVIAAIAAAALLVVGDAQTQAPKSQVGRYQLFAGENQFLGHTSNSDQKNVFRIDTVTGETSIYIDGFDDKGKTISEWLPINERR